MIENIEEQREVYDEKQWKTSWKTTKSNKILPSIAPIKACACLSTYKPRMKKVRKQRNSKNPIRV